MIKNRATMGEKPMFYYIPKKNAIDIDYMEDFIFAESLLKLKKWLVISLAEINFNLDRDYELIVSENNFFIKKFPLFNSGGSKGNTNKFN